MSCVCDRIGEALPVFRIRRIEKHFLLWRDLGPATDIFTAKRQVWRCKACKRLFALVRVPEKDEQDYLVRPPDDDFLSWDWASLVEATSRSIGWKGLSSGEAKFVL